MFPLILILSATPVDCTTLQKVVDRAPTASAPRLLLSVCLERACAKPDAIAIARAAIPLALAEDGWPQHGLNHLQPTLKRLAALGVDLPIPAPATCTRTCRLVAADPCLELVASVCTLKLDHGEPQTVVLDHRVEHERSDTQK